MRWIVIDLFSGAGGMSYGFHAHPHFDVVAAVDAQVGKPSSGMGTLGCNNTYAANIGIVPFERDLSHLDGSGLARLLSSALNGQDLDVILACPPCTGFSRTNPSNHLRDDPRNSLVVRVAIWVAELQPKVVIMENARELIHGNFSYHYERLRKELRQLGYKVHGSIYFLDRFGLPQKRQRALIIAARSDVSLRTLENLWRGYRVSPNATTVRRAIAYLPPVEAGEAHPSDPMHVCPKLARATTRRRLQLLPKDGGAWIDLVSHPEADEVLTPAMKRYVAEGKLGSHPDVYGRLWWDRPAVTIKRECAHVGNGRYSHPEQDRLLTVREMAILQGFPADYVFKASSLANMYRHIGDAVPPLISYQLAWVASWMLSGEKPRIEDIVLPGTHLRPEDIVDETTSVGGMLPLFDRGSVA